jgi:hypothetical protein
MALATNTVKLRKNDGEWTEISTSKATVKVTLVGLGKVELIVADSKPAIDSVESGHYVSSEHRQETFFFLGTNNVYARTVTGIDSVLAVSAY